MRPNSRASPAATIAIVRNALLLNPSTSPMTSSGPTAEPATRAISGDAIEEGTATASVVSTSTTSRATHVGLRRQSNPEPAPTALSRAIASAVTAVPAKTTTAIVASARNRARCGSAIIPPARAASARHGTPTPNTVASVAAETGSLPCA